MKPITTGQQSDYVISDSVQASTSSGITSGESSMHTLRREVSNNASDYEKEGLIKEKFDALRRLVSNYNPNEPTDFSGFSLYGVDVSQAVSQGLQQQWTDAGVERYLNSSNGHDFVSFITNNTHLNLNQRVEFVDGLVNSLRESGVDLTTLPDSLLNNLSQPLYSINNNISDFINNGSTDDVEREHINDLQRLLGGGSNDSGIQGDLLNLDGLDFPDVDNYKIPEIQGYKNVEALKGNKNGYLADTANTLVRNRFENNGIKSGNKVRPSDSNSVARLNNAGGIIIQMRNEGPGPYGLLDYTNAMEKGAGNCDEMSGIAEQIINNTQDGYARKYKIDNKPLHAFTLVGKPPAGAKDHVKFSDYGACWICDPWANITCKASEYGDKFRNKMDEWAAKGKYLSTSDGWVIANDPRWVDAVVDGTKSQIFPESYYNIHDEPAQDKPAEKLPPSIKESLSALDPQQESTSLPDMYQALTKAKELGSDTLLSWLSEAQVAKRLVEGILSGKAITGGALVLENTVNNLLDIVKEGQIPAARIYSALFSPEAKDFILAAMPQLMLKPAGVRLAILMEQLSLRDSNVQSDLVDAMKKKSIVPSIERAYSENSTFYDRINSVYKLSVKPKETAYKLNQTGKLNLNSDIRGVCLFHESGRLLNLAGLMDLRRQKNTPLTQLRQLAENYARLLGNMQYGNRTVTADMLKKAQIADNVSYGRHQAGAAFWSGRFAAMKVAADEKSTESQHRPEPEWVKMAYAYARGNELLARISNLQKQAEWEFSKKRQEPQTSKATQSSGFHPVRLGAALALEVWAEDQQSMLRPAGRDINAMIAEGQLRQEIHNQKAQEAAIEDLRHVWENSYDLLMSGVPDRFQDNLLSVMGACETAILADSLATYASALRAVNDENARLISELSENGWGLATTSTEVSTNREKEQVEQTNTSPSASPPVKKSKRKTALLAD